MKHITNILKEKTLNLNNTEKAVIASIAISPSGEMAYGELVGARNSTAARKSLEHGGFIKVNDSSKSAQLTSAGRDVLTADNLLDDSAKLTDRGKQLVDKYRNDKTEWKQFESIRSLNSTDGI